MRTLLAATVAAGLLVGCGSYNPPPPGAPTVKSSADQTIAPKPTATPGPSPRPTVSGYPIERWEKLQEASK